MFLQRTSPHGLMFGIAAVFLAASDSQANVNLEFRPATQTVVNGTTVGVGVFAVSDDASDQQVGLVQIAFTWDETVLELAGVLANGPYTWLAVSFPNDSSSDGLNAPFGPLPDNDGDALLVALSQLPPAAPAMATPAGLLVATIQFTAIDTGVDSPVAIESLLGSTPSQVFDAPLSGVNVTGTIGAPVTVTVICNTDPDCDNGNACTTDACAGQICSHTPVAAGNMCGDQANSSCDNPDTCDANGNCLANLETAGTTCGSPTDTDCDNPDTCDGAGACLSNYESTGIACGSPSDTECDNPDMCDGGGICLANYEDGGISCGDPSNTECDDADSCDGAGVCLENPAASGVPCGSPVDDACTDADTCDGGGFCLDNDFFCFPGTPFCIDDGEGLPLCVECLFGNNAPCNDNNFCTTDFCDLTGTCLNAPDPKNGLPCPDELFCNGAEVCDDGLCLAPSMSCDDDNVCTDDSCNEGTDQCINVPNDNNDPDDGEFCNGTDTCLNGFIIPGDPPDCEDGNLCTTGSCNEATNSCDQIPNANDCDDGEVCTQNDQCGGGVCQPGDPPGGSGLVDFVWVPMSPTVMVGDPVLLGLNACSTDGQVHEVFGVEVVLFWDPTVLSEPQIVNNGPYTWLLSYYPFQNPLNDTHLDGDAFYVAFAQLAMPVLVGPDCLLVTSFEFGTENLSAGSVLEIVNCTGELPSISRIDGGVAGSIQGNLGSATVTVAECLTDAQCDNGIFCDGAEQCVQNFCDFGPPPCDDGNICTTDVCDEGAQDCQHIPLTGDFDQDGLFCTGIDVCEDGVFIPGTPPDCDDNNICTDDSCNEIFDECDNDPNNISCNDNNGCTANDTCSDGVCSGTVDPDCIPCNNPADCEDGIDCTANLCTLAGVCLFDPDDAECPDDGVFCNGVEFCDPPSGDPTTGCASAGPPCPDCIEEFGCECQPPLVEAVGGKYFKVTPLPFGSPTPMAIVVTCAGGTARYVGPLPQQQSAIPFDLTNDAIIDGSVAALVDNPGDALFLTPAEWLGDVYVTGELVIPSTDYMIQVDCGQPGSPNLTDPVAATTWAFGDVFNDPGPVNLNDVFAAVLAFQGTWFVAAGPTTKPQMDFDFCMPNQVISLADVFRIVQAFQGLTYAESYASSNCALTCP